MSSLLGGLGGASLGSAVLKLSTNGKGYRKGLKDAEGQARGFGKRSAVAVAAGAAGFTLLAGAAALSIRSFARAGDEVQKMALRTGFSTEALSELRHAAELSGTSLEGLETGIRRMQRTVFDAASGLAEAERSLEELGLTAAELQNLSPEEQFNRIAGALAKVEDESKRAALAQIVFGRSGTALLPMLAQGAEGLEAMRQEARDLGIVFDQEAADKAAQFNDALTRLSASGRAFGMEFAGAVVPALTVGIELLTGLTQDFAALPGPIQTAVAAFGGLAVVVPAVAFAFAQIGPAIIGAGAAMAGFNLALIATPIGMAAMAVALIAGVFLWGRFRDAVSEAREAAAEFAIGQAAVRAAEELSEEQLRTNIETIDDRVATLVAERDQLIDSTAGWVQYGRATSDQLATFEQLNKEIGFWTPRLEINRQALKLQTDQAEQAAKTQRDMEEATEAASAAMRDQADALREMTAAGLAAALAADILAQAPEDEVSAFAGALERLRPLVEQEREVEALVAALLGAFDPVASSAEEAGEELSNVGSAANDAADEIKELEQATKALVDAERARADELHSRSTSNLDALLRAAQQGANQGINVDNVLAAIAEQQALAGNASQDLARLNPDDPRHQPTASLINYGHIDVHTTDLPDQGAALEELIP